MMTLWYRQIVYIFFTLALSAPIAGVPISTIKSVDSFNKDSTPVPTIKIPDVQVKLPFSEMLNLPTLNVKGQQNARASGNVIPEAEAKYRSKSLTTQVNLPFSNFKVPFMESFMKGLPQTLRDSLEKLRDRQPVKLNYPIYRIPGAPKPPQTAEAPPGSFASARDEFASVARSGKADPPLSIINLPFYDFKLPFTEVTRNRKIPMQALYMNQGKLARFEMGKEIQLHQLSRLDSNELLSVLKEKPRISLPPTPGFKGNMESVNKSGPINTTLPLPNKLSLPYSILLSPLNTFQMPLSHLLLPLSRGMFGTSAYGDVKKTGSPFNIAQLWHQLKYRSPLDNDGGSPLDTDAYKSTQPGGIGQESAAVASVHGGISGSVQGNENLSTVAGELQEAMTPNLGFNLNDFGLPLSFLNTPLAYMNMPFSFTNLPFSSLTLPFAQLNTPLSGLNVPFAEIIQTFNAPPAPVLRSGFRDKNGDGNFSDNSTEEASLNTVEIEK